MLCGFSINHKLRQGSKNLIGLVKASEGLDKLACLGLVLFLNIINGAGTIGDNVIDNLLEQTFLRI